MSSIVVLPCEHEALQYRGSPRSTVLAHSCLHRQACARASKVLGTASQRQGTEHRILIAMATFVLTTLCTLPDKHDPTRALPMLVCGRAGHLLPKRRI